MLGGAVIVRGDPEPTKVPPQLPEYQLSTGLEPVPPSPPIAVKTTLLPAQTGFGVALAEVGAVGLVSTITVTLAHADEPHPFCQLA